MGSPSETFRTGIELAHDCVYCIVKMMQHNFSISKRYVHVFSAYGCRRFRRHKTMSIVSLLCSVCTLGVWADGILFVRSIFWMSSDAIRWSFEWRTDRIETELDVVACHPLNGNITRNALFDRFRNWVWKHDGKYVTRNISTLWIISWINRRRTHYIDSQVCDRMLNYSRNEQTRCPEAHAQFSQYDAALKLLYISANYFN